MTDKNLTSGKPYQPKGGMCCNCINMQDKKFDCSLLPFDKMIVIKEEKDCLIVKCNYFLLDIA